MLLIRDVGADETHLLVGNNRDDMEVLDGILDQDGNILPHDHNSIMLTSQSGENVTLVSD